MNLTTLAASALHRLRSLFASADPVVRMLTLFGLFLTATGAFHVGVWLLAGAPSLEGPVSWRKPIVFGISSGLATFSVAWVASLLPATTSRARAAWIYAVTMVLEVGLIDLQRWRGVASHFNNATVLDTSIYNVMAVLIITSVSASGVLGWKVFRSVDLPQDTRLAGVLGVAFLLAGALMGLAISVHGSIVMLSGVGTPSMVGAAPMKFPHAIAVHALQVLPVIAWLLSRTTLAVGVRARLVVRSAVGYALLFVAALVQMMLGHAPTDPAFAALAIAALGVVLLASPLVHLFTVAAPRATEIA